MATQAQIESVLKISGAYSLINGAASITDISNYTGIGIVSPDTVKILLYIQDSTGQPLYKSSGYDTANFTTPDLQPLLGTATFNFTLPQTVTGDYLVGQYTINMKVQVDESGQITNAFKVLYQNISPSCAGVVPNVQSAVSYNTAEVGVTDNTSYGTYTSLSNTLSIYPPAPTQLAGQSFTANGTPATLIYQPAQGTYPYTGVWTWTLSTDITYTDPITGASTTCRIQDQGTFEVVQSQLCKVLCVIKKYRTQAIQTASTQELNGKLMMSQLQKAEGEYLLAFAAERCGRPQSEIDTYIASIYEILGASKDCDCGCDDGVSQPLVPTSIIQGANGTNGSVIYSSSGAPNNGTGVVGDYYVDIVAPNGFYKKTGATTWTFLFNMQGSQGATGATGAAGAAGMNGTSIIDSLLVPVPTTTTTWEDLAQPATSPSSPALNLQADRDMVVLTATLSSPSGSNYTRNTRIQLQNDGNIVLLSGLNFGFYAANIVKVQYRIEATRVSSSLLRIEMYVTQNTEFAGTESRAPYTRVFQEDIGSIDYTLPITFNIQADSVVAGDITLETFCLLIYKPA